MATASYPRILILGGGFAGMSVAQELIRLLPRERRCDITLVDRNNFSLFTPMLTEVVGGDVDPGSVVAAIRSLSPRVRFEQGRITRIDAASRSVSIEVGDGAQSIPPAERTLQADQLVIALGSITNFHHIPGLQDNALTIKSVTEAEAIRHRAIALLERADEEPDPAVRRQLLTFVVGGGGFSGVETMAALNDLVRGLRPQFSAVQAEDVRTIIVQPGPRLLPELDERLASYAQRELERRGVEVMLGTRVASAGPDNVELERGDAAHGDDHSSARAVMRVAARTLVWAGGVQPNPVVAQSGFKLGRHHAIVVDAGCAVPGHAGVWALGDCAEVPEPRGKGTYAPTAQNATREGKQVARNIVATLN